MGESMAVSDKKKISWRTIILSLGVGVTFGVGSDSVIFALICGFVTFILIFKRKSRIARKERLEEHFLAKLCDSGFNIEHELSGGFKFDFKFDRKNKKMAITGVEGYQVYDFSDIISAKFSSEMNLGATGYNDYVTINVNNINNPLLKFRCSNAEEWVAKFALIMDWK